MIFGHSTCLQEIGHGLEDHPALIKTEYIQVIMHGLEVDTVTQCGLLQQVIFICLVELDILN